MYNVHMKKYTVGLVRERLSEALDEAQRGEPVLIQRDQVTYRLSVEPAAVSRRRVPAPKIDLLDPALADGQWTWSWSGGSLRYRARGRKRR
jgi:antitoxin (DNA-binding transcriptional repressor) of toxin-antitoxin stability system